MVLTSEFKQTFIEEIISILHNLLKNIQDVGIFPKLFYKACIILTAKQKKIKKNNNPETYRRIQYSPWHKNKNTKKQKLKEHSNGGMMS